MMLDEQITADAQPGAMVEFECVEFEMREATVVEQTKQKLDDILSAADTLTLDEKAALVKHLLGSAPLSVVFGGSQQISGSIGVQINMVSHEVLADFVEAIAERIKGE